MPETIALKLTVYQPGTIAGPGQQVGFEYDLTIEVADLTKTAVKGNRATSMTLANEMSAISSGRSAKCDVVDVTGTLSLPNPAAPVISPFRGLLFIYDDSPIIGFPLTIMAESTEETSEIQPEPSLPLRLHRLSLRRDHVRRVARPAQQRYREFSRRAAEAVLTL